MIDDRIAEDSTPYGTQRDLLWLGRCGDSIPQQDSTTTE